MLIIPKFFINPLLCTELQVASCLLGPFHVMYNKTWPNELRVCRSIFHHSKVCPSVCGHQSMAPPSSHTPNFGVMSDVSSSPKLHLHSISKYSNGVTPFLKSYNDFLLTKIKCRLIAVASHYLTFASSSACLQYQCPHPIVPCVPALTSLLNLGAFALVITYSSMSLYLHMLACPYHFGSIPEIFLQNSLKYPHSSHSPSITYSVSVTFSSRHLVSKETVLL